MSPPAQTAPDHLLSRFLGILPSTPEEKILRMLIELGCEVVGGQEGSLLVYDKDADLLRFAMTVGDPESEKKLRGQAVPLGRGPQPSHEVRRHHPLLVVGHDEGGAGGQGRAHPLPVRPAPGLIRPPGLLLQPGPPPAGRLLIVIPMWAG